MHTPTRRDVFFAGMAMATLPAFAAPAEIRRMIHVVKDANCECCTSWVEYLQAVGFVVTTEDMYGSQLIRFKLDNGVPLGMTSCHTGQIDGYIIEGHVPIADIDRLLVERPEAIGLAVPGMPYGSPGMGSEDSRDAYDVLLLKSDGTTELFARYPSR